jgi:hypothetical protein
MPVGLYSLEPGRRFATVRYPEIEHDVTAGTRVAPGRRVSEDLLPRAAQAYLANAGGQDVGEGKARPHRRP